MRGSPAPVVDHVPEGDDTRCPVVERQLQLLVLRDEVERRASRELPVDRVDDEHIVVRVVVVQQHRQERGTTGSRAELVIDGNGRYLALLDGGFLVGVILLDGLLVGFDREELVPVVDEPVVGGCRPRLARGPVVQHERVAVGEEREVGGSRCTVEIDLAVRRARAPRRTERPGGVEASVVHHRGSGGTVPPALDRLGRFAIVEADRDESASVRDRDLVTCQRWPLEERNHSCFEHRRKVDTVAATLEEQGSFRDVEHRPASGYRGDLHVGGVGGFELPLLGDSCRPARVDTGHDSSRRRVGEERARGIDRRHRPRAEGE